MLFIVFFVCYIPVLVELITITGWYFAWEAAEVYCIKRTALRHKRARNHAFITCAIEFYPLSKLNSWFFCSNMIKYKYYFKNL